MATRILHTADWHLDETATIAGQIVCDPETGLNLAMLDTVKAVQQMVAAALPLDGLVIAGDVYNRAKSTPNEQRIFAGLVDWICATAGLDRLLVIPGNHDEPRSTADATACTSNGRDPRVLLVEAPVVVEYAGIKWGCLPYPRRAALRESLEGDVSGHENEALSAALTTLAASLRAQGAEVLLAHSTIGGATVGAQPRTLDGDIEISRDALDLFPAVMLGHIHQQQIVRNAAYSGSPTVQDFGEEGERKGGILWTLENGEFLRSPIVVAGRLWQTIDVADANPEKFPRLEAGAVYRIRGELTHDDLQALRSNLAAARAQGAFIQDELRLLVEDRVRDHEIGRKGIDDAEVLRRALAARQVPEADQARLLDLHVHVQQGV